jgi:hypothetical protein
VMLHAAFVNHIAGGLHPLPTLASSPLPLPLPPTRAISMPLPHPRLTFLRMLSIRSNPVHLATGPPHLAPVFF